MQYEIKPYIGTNVVEEELGTSRTADIDSPSQLDRSRLVGFAILEVLEVLLKLANVVIDMILRIG